MPNTVKVSSEQWINAAKDTLVREGLRGVKIDRLAKRLGVTRGGFYHNFGGQTALLEKLVQEWVDHNQLVPELPKVSSPSEALKVLEQLVVHTIQETDFSPAFELAIREWARTDKKVGEIVERVDDERMQRLTDIFTALGCDEEEAPIRSRVWYYHQLGFYSLKRHERQPPEERFRNSSIYLRILCGKRYIEAAEAEINKWS